MTDNMKKLEDLFKDENLAKEILSIEKPEAAQAWLSEHGVDLSMDEIMSIGGILNKLASGEITQEQVQKAANGELSEEELKHVAGGLEWDSDDPNCWALAGSGIGAVIGIVSLALISW